MNLNHKRLSMGNRSQTLILNLIVIAMVPLIGCVTSQTSVGGSPQYWENYAYKYDKFDNVPLSTPSCTSPNSISGNSFMDQEDYEACKRSVNSYVTEIDRWVRIRGDYVSEIFNNVQTSVNKYLECRSINGATCGAYEPPETFMVGNLLIAYMQYWADKKWDEHCIAYSYSCEMAAEKYIGDIKKYLQDYHRREVSTARENQDKAIREFNCKAEGKKHCW